MGGNRETYMVTEEWVIRSHLCLKNTELARITWRKESPGRRQQLALR